jgi:hypothetical protein
MKKAKLTKAAILIVAAPLALVAGLAMWYRKKKSKL